ncbi:TetR/AcrR family transcriptional regulator [Streptococcus ferus]|uniref:TetR/AcrR family transcriptional regulator n=1 Tax=Streptococcus ferus TaxID=1345 RepID=UPI0035174DA5
MAERKMAEASLKNLQKANWEAHLITKESLETALLFLLQQKKLSDISISELVLKAGVSRNAFYRHYRSKDELLKKLLKKNVLKIVKGLQCFHPIKERYQAWHFLFSQVRQQKELLHLAKHSHFDQWLKDIVTEGLERYQRRKQRILADYVNTFWASAVISVLSKWIRDGMIIPEEEMAHIDLPLLP